MFIAAPTASGGVAASKLACTTFSMKVKSLCRLFSITKDDRPAARQVGAVKMLNNGDILMSDLSWAKDVEATQRDRFQSVDACEYSTRDVPP